MPLPSPLQKKYILFIAPRVVLLDIQANTSPPKYRNENTKRTNFAVFCGLGPVFRAPEDLMDRSRSWSWPKRPKNRTGPDFQTLASAIFCDAESLGSINTKPVDFAHFSYSIYI